MRTKEEIKEYQKLWRERNKDKIRSYFKKWYAKGYKKYYKENKSKISSLRNEWRNRTKDRYELQNNARVEVRLAIDSGRLVKLPCAVCGSSKSEAHHEDYLKPLEVIWLCKTHHFELHSKK